MHILIDKLRLYLGIHNLLLGIQPVIAGKHVADRTTECIICHSMNAEHLNAEHDGRKRAIRYAAEYRRHAERSRKRRGKPKQSTPSTAARKQFSKPTAVGICAMEKVVGAIPTACERPAATSAEMMHGTMAE